MKVKPGISSFVDDPDHAGPSLAPLFDFARRTLKAAGCEAIDTVPVFLGATAGMRILAPKDSVAIMMSVKEYIKSSGFRMDDSSWIRVISGERGGRLWMARRQLAAEHVEGVESRG